MKTYVIMISERFPQTHKRAGEQTNFKDKIDSIDCDLPFPPFDPKIHTIRANYELWKKRFDQIDAGKAVLSVRVWKGKPYNSKQKEIFRFDKTHSIGIQKIKSWDFEKGFAFYIGKNRNVLPVNIGELAKNDGLSLDDFDNWFAGYDLNKPMAIIHFTEFRY
jgi:hypothetical protein